MRAELAIQVVNVVLWAVGGGMLFLFGYDLLEVLRRIATALEKRNALAQAEIDAWDAEHEGSRLQRLFYSIRDGLWAGRQ